MKMIGTRWMKALYFGTGANLSFFIQDLDVFLELGVGQGDVIVTGAVTGFGVLTISGIELYHRYFQEPMEDLGLDLDEDFSTDAEYSCSYCGDPVKMGDRVLREGKTYCTREHAEEDKE